ncbi:MULTISPECIES: hypothetical protein [unclassified Streptomyces]|uniref:hypothetical protein n=1 Tax=unclassified Streptomyces TaxID=2593676 RepID=UPI00111420C1|nr:MULTISPECIES: hypothetical protein [unclassified Streptomyces]
MTHRTHGSARRAVCLSAAAVLLVGGCDFFSTDKTPERQKNGTDPLELTVSGRPTPGSLAVTEHVLARLRARDAEGLADFAAEEGDPRADARRLVEQWGAAAQRPATAEFHPGEKYDPSVTVKFAGAGPELSLLLVPEDEDDPGADVYVVLLGEEFTR